MLGLQQEDGSSRLAFGFEEQTAAGVYAAVALHVQGAPVPLPELSAWPSRFVKKGSQEAEDAYSQVAAESDEGQTRALLGAAALLNHACRQHAQVQTADWRTFQLRYSCRKGEQLFIYYNQSRASLPCAVCGLVE